MALSQLVNQFIIMKYIFYLFLLYLSLAFLYSFFYLKIIVVLVGQISSPSATLYCFPHASITAYITKAPPFSCILANLKLQVSKLNQTFITLNYAVTVSYYNMLYIYLSSFFCKFFYTFCKVGWNRLAKKLNKKQNIIISY